MSLWKLNVKTVADHGENPKTYCLAESIIGVGWPVKGIPQAPTSMQYLKAARTRYVIDGKKFPSALNAITEGISIDDLVWLRSDSNEYYLGRVTGEWNYASFDGKGDDWDKNGIHNYREVEWHRIGTAEVIPWAIRKQFSRGTLNRINADGAAMLAFSKRRWNQTTSDYKYELSDESNTDASLFSYVGPDACEDMVALYLQSELGYALIPSTCKRTTKHYEFVLRHKDGHRAYVQVKNGTQQLSGKDFSGVLTDPRDKFYLFTLGVCSAEGIHGVECLDPAVVENWFTQSNYSDLFPGVFARNPSS